MCDSQRSQLKSWRRFPWGPGSGLTGFPQSRPSAPALQSGWLGETSFPGREGPQLFIIETEGMKPAVGHMRMTRTACPWTLSSTARHLPCKTCLPCETQRTSVRSLCAPPRGLLQVRVGACTVASRESLRKKTYRPPQSVQHLTLKMLKATHVCTHIHKHTSPGLSGTHLQNHQVPLSWDRVKACILR